jgi:restriction endonuclease S subunit
VSYSPRNAALQLQYGLGNFNQFQTETTNLRNLNFPDFITNIHVPIPPRNEQQRIVDRTRQAQAEVSSAKERLYRTSPLLKHFRQSVLAAACSGKLTEDWRSSSSQTETAEELLTRILRERRDILTQNSPEAEGATDTHERSERCNAVRLDNGDR